MAEASLVKSQWSSGSEKGRGRPGETKESQVGAERRRGEGERERLRPRQYRLKERWGVRVWYWPKRARPERWGGGRGCLEQCLEGRWRGGSFSLKVWSRSRGFSRGNLRWLTCRVPGHEPPPAIFGTQPKHEV